MTDITEAPQKSAPTPLSPRRASDQLCDGRLVRCDRAGVSHPHCLSSKELRRQAAVPCSATNRPERCTTPVGTPCSRSRTPSRCPARRSTGTWPSRPHDLTGNTRFPGRATRAPHENLRGWAWTRLGHVPAGARLIGLRGWLDRDMPGMFSGQGHRPLEPDPVRTGEGRGSPTCLS